MFNKSFKCIDLKHFGHYTDTGFFVVCFNVTVGFRNHLIMGFQYFHRTDNRHK